MLTPSKKTLAIYTNDDDHRTGSPSKGEVRDLTAYAIIRLRGSDGAITLALLPRTAAGTMRPAALPPPAGTPACKTALAIPQSTAVPTGGVNMSIASPAHMSPGAAGDGSESNKSWYLRAASSELTTEWFRRIEEAGAHATDTVHETARANYTPTFVRPKRSQVSYRANK